MSRSNTQPARQSRTDQHARAQVGGPRRIRLLIVDDSDRVRRGLTALFAAVGDVEVVASAADGRIAVSLVAERSPDVALIDVVMPEMDGIEATRRIRSDHPGTAVVIFSALADRRAEALAAGAAGYVSKDAPPREVLHQIRSAAPSARRGEHV